MFVEKAFKSGKAMGYPLRIVEPVNRENNLLLFEILPDLLPLFDDFGIRCRVVKFIKVDSKGKHFRFDDPLTHFDISKLAVVTVHHLHRLEEVLHVLMRMEANQIRAKEAADNLPLPGLVQHAKHLERREWNVKKKSDRRLRLLRANKSGHMHELIIMDPDNIVGPHDGQQLFRKDFVDFAIAIVTRFIKLC